jgi:hypothetical protein
MLQKVKRVWVPLAAAAVTAAAFAAVSVAQDDDRSADAPKREGDVFLHRAGPALSEEDQAKMEEFRQCMEDNGAPAPPEPPSREDLENGDVPGPPEPPSEADREAVEKTLKACEDKAPEGFGMHIGPGGPCGPPPGAPGERGQREGSEDGASLDIPDSPPSAQS